MNRHPIEMTKHHGLGNDFLVATHHDVRASVGNADDTTLASLARRVCDRRHGVGADGLLLIVEESGVTARMVLFNADGSRAEISGNGIRCFAQALSLRNGSLAAITVATDVGERRVELSATDDPLTVQARVPMGRVGVGVAPEGWHEIGVNPDRPVAHLDLGNPHTVVGVDDVEAVDLGSLGARIPQVNLEIVEPGPSPNSIRMRVHERGVGITLACGSGACAAAHAAQRWGLVPAAASAVTVVMDGGVATVEVDTPGPEEVTLTGPATFVARLSYQP